MATRSVRTAATSEWFQETELILPSLCQAGVQMHHMALVLQDTQGVEAQCADSEPLERCAAPHHPAESHNPCPQV